MRIDFGEIEIPIGYKIQISAEHNDLKIENFKLLGKSIAEKTIDMIKALDEFERKDTITNEMEFEFCNADFAGSKMIILTTVHHQEKPMTFNAKIKIKGRKKYITTSIVTKYPHAISIEQWSENIESIILYDFKLISEIN
jgi:hypothetical protein